jgi:hypothetical protein
MLSFRAHVIILVAAFGSFLCIAIGGNVLQAAGVFHDVGAWKIPVAILVFSLLAASGFAAVPVIVMSVMGFQRRIGNEKVPAIESLLKAQKSIIYTIWALMLGGLIVGVPAAIYGHLLN